MSYLYKNIDISIQYISNLSSHLFNLLAWLLFLCALISSGNAVIRKFLGYSSNAWLELQWYLFAMVFLLGAGHALQENRHVRIDILYNRFSQRARLIINMVSFLCAVLPVSLVLCYLGWLFFARSVTPPDIGFDNLYWGEQFVAVWHGIFDMKYWEYSSDAGGLPTWPAKLMLPLGALLLSIQALLQFMRYMLCLAGVYSQSDILRVNALL